MEVRSRPPMPAPQAPARRGKARQKLKSMARATRSGLRRYPRAIWASMNGRAAAPGRREALTPHLDPHGLAAMWLGHGTVLLRLGGLNVLLDPVFSERIGLSLGPLTLGLARLNPAPLAAHELPHIDLVLISHA